MNNLVNVAATAIGNLRLEHETESSLFSTTKLKKNRRFRRKKATDNDSNQIRLTLRIQEVVEPNGTFFRKSNGKKKKINLPTSSNTNRIIVTSEQYLPKVKREISVITQNAPKKVVRNRQNSDNLSETSSPLKIKENNKGKTKTNNPNKTKKVSGVVNNENEEIKKGNENIPQNKKENKRNNQNKLSQEQNRKSNENGASNNKKKKQPREKFKEYLSKEAVDLGLANGEFVKGFIRINPKFYTEAYVSQIDKTRQDYFIGSVADRNRALEGDEVVLQIKPKSEWRDNQQKAQVIHILQKVHPRIAVGYLVKIKDQNKDIASFHPRDKRIPFMNIDEKSLPKNFFQVDKMYKNTLFLAKLTEWTNPKYAIGMIIDRVGTGSDLKSENKAILLENQIDVTPFPKEMYKYFSNKIIVPSDEYEKRKDLRKECIFTIDPLTARDLDDAVSCKELPNGNYEIGVHIADVSYFLSENTPLDKLVCKKATTTYLVDNVYHMLPPELCLHCSLLPGKDCLTFSVIWEIDQEANIISTNITRSVINSCGQLAYENAQKIIDSASHDFDANQFPIIRNNFSIKDVVQTIKNLQKIAVQLRKKRFDNGALRIDQVKLGFQLDEKGHPENFYVQEIKDANRLIEEFMLLANISVAKRIFKDFPDLAFLRCHEEPNLRMLAEVQTILETVGMHIDISDSKNLYTSLSKFQSQDYLGIARCAALNHLMAKPMTRAKYFCANQSDPETFHHYALSIPIYTHFTSPIRRYADIMVHRLLCASLGYSSHPEWKVDNVQSIAENCNKQKFAAKKAGEASSELYLAHYVEQNKPYYTDAVVIGVTDKSFDAITIQTGSVVRIYTNGFEEDVKHKVESYGNNDKKLHKISIVYPATKELNETLQVIEMFQIIQVELKRKTKENSYKLEAILVRPRHVKILPTQC